MGRYAGRDATEIFEAIHSPVRCTTRPPPPPPRESVAQFDASKSIKRQKMARWRRRDMCDHSFARVCGEGRFSL